MMKTKIYSWACIGLLALSPMLVSCNNDDDEDKIEILLPIAGNYTGSEVCDGAGGEPSDPYDMVIYNTATDPNQIWIENFYGLGLKLKANYDGGNGFTLPSQDIAYKVSATVTLKGKISGTGKVEDGKLTFDFVTTDDLEDKCQFVGVRDDLQPPVGL